LPTADYLEKEEENEAVSFLSQMCIHGKSCFILDKNDSCFKMTENALFIYYLLFRFGKKFYM